MNTTSNHASGAVRSSWRVWGGAVRREAVGARVLDLFGGEAAFGADDRDRGVAVSGEVGETGGSLGFPEDEPETGPWLADEVGEGDGGVDGRDRGPSRLLRGGDCDSPPAFRMAGADRVARQNGRDAGDADLRRLLDHEVHLGAFEQCGSEDECHARLALGPCSAQD